MHLFLENFLKYFFRILIIITFATAATGVVVSALYTCLPTSRLICCIINRGVLLVTPKKKYILSEIKFIYGLIFSLLLSY